MNRAGIVLAAGQGKRMKSALPKVMHPVAGLPMIGHVIAAMRGADVSRIVVVTAPGDDATREFAAANGAQTVVQERPLGTGHAAASAQSALGDFDGELIVSYGDHPLFTSETFESSFAARKEGLALVAFNPADKAMYGRVILDGDGFVERMVEFKDANARELAENPLCNAGVISADAKSFFRWAAGLTNDNSQGEFYLTGVPMIARAAGSKTAVVVIGEREVQGVNDKVELAAAEQEMQVRLRTKALADGAVMMAPDTVFLSWDTKIEADARIAPYVIFGPGVRIGNGAEIRSFSHLEGAEVAGGAIVGPFARLRPGARLGEDVHIGNFVEVKNARVERGAKANHLAYLGDARVGEGANIGAGTITCNYDGFEKHFTDIGAGAFVGSNAALVAPVKIADGSYVGAGSVITKANEKDSLVVTRAEQKEVAGWAAKFRKRRAQEKAAKAAKDR
ncbi:MAG: bifunctional UDP-N-acetylglucosamine diphosphorylase/glucosamine-1-phosphate N-acetyltransferase GlmU [Alphaproteobacteria bacterium]|nr:bifunctional UDP-N-acetylglucosamine diphosphorylase/glucosamine-1-phosphate N-acetyltransferase GlmU [Alphaproteobacteria bacterium]